ncbi:transmembrane, partial [Cystoisospora suis]
YQPPPPLPQAHPLNLNTKQRKKKKNGASFSSCRSQTFSSICDSHTKGGEQACSPPRGSTISSSNTSSLFSSLSSLSPFLHSFFSSSSSSCSSREYFYLTSLLSKFSSSLRAGIHRRTSPSSLHCSLSFLSFQSPFSQAHSLPPLSCLSSSSSPSPSSSILSSQISTSSSLAFAISSSSSSPFYCERLLRSSLERKTRLYGATRSGVAIPPQVASFGRTFVFAFLKPLKKDQEKKKKKQKENEVRLSHEEEKKERKEEKDGEDELRTAEEKKRRSYFEDFDESYDVNEEVRRLNELHKFYAVHTYPTTTSPTPTALSDAPHHCQEEEEELGKNDNSSSSSIISRKRLDPPPPCLPFPRRLNFPLTRRKRTSSLLFPSPLPRPSSSSSSSSSSEAFCPCPSFVAFSPASSSSSISPVFPSLPIPPNLSAWGGFPLPSSTSSSSHAFLSPSLLGDWLVSQSMGRQHMQSLNIYAFDSEALPIKASEGSGVRTEDERGITIEKTLAAYAEAAPAKTGLRNEEEERKALEERNREIERNLRGHDQGYDARRDEQEKEKIDKEKESEEKRNVKAKKQEGHTSTEAEKGEKLLSSHHTDISSSHLFLSSSSSSCSSSPSSSSSPPPLSSSSPSVSSSSHRLGEGYEAYLDQLDESARGGGVAVEMWIPGVKAKDILIELRLVGREESLERVDDRRHQGSREETDKGEGREEEDEKHKMGDQHYELDEDFIFKEKVEHVEDRMFTKEKKKWIPSILPMLIINLPKSKQVLRWEIETFRTRQRKGKMMSEYDRIQRAYRLVWPADIRAAVARLDSGRLLVVVPPLHDDDVPSAPFDPYEDAKILPKRLHVEGNAKPLLPLLLILLLILLFTVTMAMLTKRLTQQHIHTDARERTSVFFLFFVFCLPLLC